ncbi:helix-turn-helix domain-containing protein [Thermomonospora umbrina]|uniref:Helix-turn-helix protein n=1 Tax=Thermomonospora umbrina TaxID=111806 RepID=A0A3D9SLG9_9ACTN|nr:helix-turn-helix transcriptional regulator [Thermomonospora umbrina]REE96772.1 helix-turn-helix protein [Thermomonospora umbrina]
MAPPKPEQSVRAFFAFHLKRLREEAGLSQPALGQIVHVSGSLISGIETCKRIPSLKLCQSLDEYYKLVMYFEALHPRVIEESGLPAGFPEFADAEATAGVIKTYQSFAIHGLFQTEDYARAVLRMGQQPDKLERLVAARMERQEILRREDPPVVVALLDASAVRRWFGDREVMREQLEHLLRLAHEPHIHVHIVPDDAQVYPEASFTLLSSPGDPEAGYSEMAGGKGLLLDDAAYVAELGVLYELIRSKALTAEDSQAFIRNVLENL